MVAPPQGADPKRRQAFDQIGLDVILLQVDERRPLLVPVGLQAEGIEQALAAEYLPGCPGHALGDTAVADAQPVEDFERALGHADRARADADLVAVVQHHHGHPARRQVDGEGEPDQATAGDDDRVVRRLGAILVGRTDVGMNGVVECPGHGDQPWRATHMARSRSAVQMPGVSMPRASSYARATLNGRQCSKMAKSP